MPKLMLAGFAANDAEAKPDPTTVTVAVGAVPEKVMVPLVLPVAWGAKVAVNPTVCPGAKLVGRLKPLTLNPVPVIMACETVTAVPPLFVKLPDWFCFVPTATFPKLKLDGVAVNAPALAPVPVRAAVSVESAAFETMVMLPEPAPDCVGAKVTLKAVLWPGARVRGNTRPMIPNTVPDAVAAEMTALVPPLFVRVAV